MRVANGWAALTSAAMLVLLAGCAKGKPTAAAVPPDPSRIIGTWTDGTLTVVVAPDFKWRFSGQVRYRCTISGYPTTCSVQAEVSGAVRPGTTYSIHDYGSDAYGNITTVSGEWDADFTRLAGQAAVAPHSGVGGIAQFTMQKVGG